MQRLTAGLLAAALLPMSMGIAAAQYDQQTPPPPPDYGDQGAPPPSSYQPLAPEQLDQLVAPIALYPDSLVAQILTGATYPAQLVAALQFSEANSNYPPSQLAEMANTQPWDPSIKSLVAFPNVLNDLNQNMNWTTQLGNAYYNEPQDVMSAVQVMRQRAYASGTLRSSNYLNVVYDPGDILIEPVNPAVVYVPYYNPWVVYGAPIPVYSGYYWGPPRGVYFGAGLALGFGLGVAIGAFSHFGWGFHSWAPNWRAHTVVFNHNTYISRSNTVINHGYYGRFDRSAEARNFNREEAGRYNGREMGNHPGVNRGAFNNGYNRGGQSFNGSNGYNRGARTYSNGANGYNHGAQPYNGGANGYNRGAQTYNNGGMNHAYNGAQAGRPAQGYNPGNAQHNEGRGQTYGKPSGGEQHAAPAEHGHAESHGDHGHENHH